MNLYATTWECLKEDILWQCVDINITEINVTLECSKTIIYVPVSHLANWESSGPVVLMERMSSLAINEDPVEACGPNRSSNRES